MEEIVKLLISLTELVWRVLINTSISLLGMQPKDAAFLPVWNIINGIKPVFQTLGAYVLEVLLGVQFLKTIVEHRKDIGLEDIAKLFLKYLVVLTVFLKFDLFINILYALASGLIGKIGEVKLGYLFGSQVIPALEDGMNFWNSGFIFILVIVVFFVVLTTGIGVLMTSAFRFYKLFIVLSYASLPLACLMGGQTMSHTGYAYVKTIILYILEPVAIVLSLFIGVAFSSIISNILLNSFSAENDLIKLVVILIIGTVNATTVGGMVYRTESILQKSCAL